MANFIDKTGLSYFWDKVRDYVDGKVSESEGGTITEVTGTAYASGWSGSPLTNVVSMPGLPEGVSGFVGLSNNATEAQRIAARNAILFPISQGDGSITLVADGQAPDVNLPIMVYYLQNVEWVEPDEPPASMVTIVLSPDGWDDNLQTISVSEIWGDETKQLIQPVAATSSKVEYESCGIQCVAQAEGSLTFSCLEVPTSNLIVYVVITELMPL